jgi:RNA polymerase sigma-70 factor (TIGR02960 family)
MAAVSADLMTRARAGDGDAFSQLIDPYRRELEVHCYRILGSAQDAEDALQETLLAAWRGFGAFEGRSSVRTWLYRIATSRCLNALRSGRRRQQPGSPPPRPDLPEPTRLGEVIWLQPYPDVFLEGIADGSPGPDARYEAREAISLAFITALQLLPPRQRAALILRDVLGFHASETAQILDVSEESVTSALKRARAAVQRRFPQPAAQEPPPQPGSARERELVERFTLAFEAGDVDGVVALMTDDVWMAMPPTLLEYQGRALAAQFLTVVRQGRSFRLVETRANGQPAFGVYLHDQETGLAHANGMLVLTMAGASISALTRFDSAVFPHFRLPLTLPS